MTARETISLIVICLLLSAAGLSWSLMDAERALHGYDRYRECMLRAIDHDASLTMPELAAIQEQCKRGM